MLNTKAKGITLIALVITIIIMLILAGTSLNLAFGEKGIITMTIRARDAYYDAEDKENKKLNGE